MEKTKSLLAYIIKRHITASLTSLLKLCYLIDVVSVKKTGKPISEFSYVRYYYGPYDDKIYTLLTALQSEGVVKSKTEYAYSGDEYVIYQSDGDQQGVSELISEEEYSLIDEVLEKLRGYGAKALTDIAYQTAPMVRIGATLGGREHLNEKLDLGCA